MLMGFMLEMLHGEQMPGFWIGVLGADIIQLFNMSRLTGELELGKIPVLLRNTVQNEQSICEVQIRKDHPAAGLGALFREDST